MAFRFRIHLSFGVHSNNLCAKKRIFLRAIALYSSSSPSAKPALVRCAGRKHPISLWGANSRCIESISLASSLDERSECEGRLFRACGSCGLVSNRPAATAVRASIHDASRGHRRLAFHIAFINAQGYLYVASSVIELHIRHPGHRGNIVAEREKGIRRISV